MDRESYPDPKVQEILKSFHIVKVDRDKRPDLVRKFTKDMGVPTLGYPTRIYLDSKGTEADRVRGYKPADKFVLELQSVLDSGGTLHALSARIREHPEDRLPRKERMLWALESMRWDLIRDDGDFLFPKLDLEKPEDRALWEELAVHHARANAIGGKRDLCIQQMERYIPLFPKGAQVNSARQILGYQYEQAGDKDKAADCYAAILRSEPKGWYADNAGKFFRRNPDQAKRFDPKTYEPKSAPDAR